MYKLSLLLRVVTLSILLLANQNIGVRLCSIQEENDSLAQDLVYAPPRRKLTSLKSNSIERKISRKGSNSEDVQYYAAHLNSVGGPDDNYYGLHAITDVYGHELKHGQLSSTGIFVSHKGDGGKSSYNSIGVGWHIYPERYGDSRPHFYAHWTRDGYETTGCYNMDCPGFIAANDATVTPGALIHSVSDVRNGHLENVTLKLFKDKKSGDWWVYYGHNGVPTAAGYYPRSLFTYLAEKASHFAFGGFVDAERALPTPPMGSGARPNSGQGHAAYFTDLRVFDQDGRSNPIMIDLPVREDNDKCYSITPVHDAECLYGGPGGCAE